MEEWNIIEDFPDYSVSSWGHVRNNNTGRQKLPTPNQQGIYQVGLHRNGIQFMRSVTLLVAKSFLPPAVDPFDTPINLDGDRANNHIDNLMWRPRWFAYKYHQQFKRGGQHISLGIMDIKTGEVTQGSRATAIRYGLIERDLILSIANKTFVWPTYQIFELVS